MIYVKPYFYDKFFCKADKCSDSCCVGWEIDIDGETLKKYKEIGGSFGKRLNDNIEENDGSYCFKLKEGDICPFLTDGLCDIYSHLGESALCEICREHPRFYEFFDSREECGLGLCCEKVCELLYEDNKELTFITEKFGESVQPEETEQLLLEAREKAFNIIRNRREPLEKRIKQLLDFAYEKQNELFGKSEKSVNVSSDPVIKTVEIMSGTEPLNRQWTEYIEMMNKRIVFIDRSLYTPDEIPYEKLLTYLIYRYFMKAMYNGNILDIVKFSVINVIFSYAQNLFTFSEKGIVTVEERIDSTKLWSKQIEYSQENIDYLTEKAKIIL